MNARESVGIALDALRAHKLRSFLTLLGIVIGVSSVIAVMSVVQGLDRYVHEKLLSAGSNVFSIDRTGLEFDLSRLRDKLRRRKLTPDDAEAVARAPHVQMACASLDQILTLRRGAKQVQRIDVHGVQGGYLEVEDRPIGAGRPLEPMDDAQHASVCVIGVDVADRLFGPLDPIGQELRAGGEHLVVVGVGERKGSAFGQSQDLYCLVPLGTFRRMFGPLASVTISVRSRGQEHFEEAQDEARAILRARRHVAAAASDDFEIVTPDMFLGLWRNLSGAIFVVVLGVSLMSLVVGGIVIMNIMLISVTERTREIGIRKAVGATRRALRFQFLIEASTLSLVGGVIGLLLGAGFAVVLGFVTPLPTFVSPLAVVLGLASSTLVGLFFGAYPADRAARLDPIDALRYE